jgi:hypothetical protein
MFGLSLAAEAVDPAAEVLRVRTVPAAAEAVMEPSRNRSSPLSGYLTPLQSWWAQVAQVAPRGRPTTRTALTEAPAEIVRWLFAASRRWKWR